MATKSELQTDNGTGRYARLHAEGQLTLPQQSAVDLLAAGQNDTQTAEALKLHRVTVTKWRLYDPDFQAALNMRRAEIWGAAGDRLRALVPKALDVLAKTLDDDHDPDQFKAALAILKTASLTPPAPGPMESDTIVRAIVDERRRNTPDPFGDFLADRNGLPMYVDHVAEVWDELKERAEGQTAQTP